MVLLVSWKSKKSFLERWEATRKRGKAKYVLCCIALYLVCCVCCQSLSLFIHEQPITALRLSDLYLGSGMILILGVLFSFLSWSANESHYKAIKEQEALQSVQNEQDRSDILANAVFAYISCNYIIYQVTQMNPLEESLIGEKIQSEEIENENYDFYKIKQMDTDKAIALRAANNSFYKYEYLCDENFTWENKIYNISCSGGALENESNDLDFACHVGKALGKIGNLELFENENSANSLLVHPDGLVCETGTGNNGYFLAAATSKSSAETATK